MKRLGRTSPFRTAAGDILPGRVAEIAYLRLGGLDQWVMIRGENIASPILVLLHGGPGFPEARLFRHFNWPLEKLFTVVYWDRRGTNKSFDRHRIPPSSMTIDRFITDLDELVDTVCRRFDRRTVAIYGHSWGSAAPEKKLVWFEHSAHEPPWEEPATFNRAMAELVRPIAV